MSNCCRYLFCCLLLLALVSSNAWAGPFEIFGTGSRAIAMGGAYTAISDDLAGTYYNIAGLTQVERFHFEVGYSYAEPHLTINGEYHDIDPNRGTTFGVVVSNIVLGHRISTGVCAFIPDDHVIRFLVLPAEHPHFALVANANHTVVALVGIGVEVTKWMSLGLGVNALGDNSGGVNFSINENEPSQGALSSEIGNYFSPMAGLWFHPAHWLRLGASYREKVEMALDLPNKINIPPITGFDETGVPILRESKLTLLAYTWSHFSPRQFSIGTSFKPLTRLTVSSDMTFMRWSEMRTDAPYSFVYLSGGLHDIFPTQNGSPPPEPHAHDTFNPSLGVEGRVLEMNHFYLDLRGGYRYRPTPFPEQTGTGNFLDSDTHIFSTGLGFSFNDLLQVLPRPFSFDVYSQFHLHERRLMEKADPANKVGDIMIEGYWWNLGGSLTLRF